MKEIKNIIPEDQVDLVRKFYNYSTPLYRNATGDFLHGYATFNSDDYMNYLVELLIDDNQIVLDAGCGLAAVSIELAKKTNNTRFQGITISNIQAQWAINRIDEEKLTDRITIVCGDYHKLNEYFPENNFDVILFVESMFHSGNPDQVLLQAYKMLKPGGKMYLREFFKIPYSTNEDISKRELVVDQIIKNYHYYPPLLDEYLRMVASIGFKISSAKPPPYPSDFEKLIKLEKAIGFDTYKYIAEFPATEWYEIVAIK